MLQKGGIDIDKQANLPVKNAAELANRSAGALAV